MTLRTTIGHLVTRLRWFRRDRSGAIAVVFGLTATALVPLAAMSVEYHGISSLRAKMQQAADTAALAAAREMRFATSDTSVAAQVAVSYARSALVELVGDASGEVAPTVDASAGTVRVDIARAYVPVFGQSLLPVPKMLLVNATGRIGGSAPICVLGLEQSRPQTVLLEKSARIEANNCSVYANSTNPTSLMTKNASSIIAGAICSAGGQQGNKSSFQPDPLTNCPQLADPLSRRQPPAVGACTETNLIVSARDLRLRPGVYCGGLHITNRANVRLDPGVYVIKDGPLRVDDNSSLAGTYVGFYLTGANATIAFQPASSISLGAPRDGPLASLLFFEDRAAPAYRRHRITSNDARTLLGTIYLPQGNLHIDAEKPVAQNSAYTIIVVRQLTLSEGPTLVMNSNYSATDVPVPEQIRGIGRTTQLIR